MENRIKQIKIEVNDDLLGFSFCNENGKFITWNDLTDEEKNFVVNSMQQGADFFGQFLGKIK